MEIVVCVERRGKTMPSRATPLQCMEHKSEINRMFIEQLFQQWWQLVPARPRGIVFNRGTEREREQAKCCLAAVLQRNATPAGCTGDYSGTDITRAG